MALDTQTYRERLEVLLKELTEELTSVGIHNPKNPQDWIAVPEAFDTSEPDQNLAADTVEEWDERRALVATLETRYNNITRALSKIDTGTFGFCEVCGAPIEADRLNANPAARTDKAHRDDEGTLPN